MFIEYTKNKMSIRFPVYSIYHNKINMRILVNMFFFYFNMINIVVYLFTSVKLALVNLVPVLKPIDLFTIYGSLK